MARMGNDQSVSVRSWRHNPSFLVLGYTPRNETWVPIEIPIADLAQGMLVVGRQGIGTSTWLQSFLMGVIAEGLGALIVDVKGTLVSALRSHIPDDRQADVREWVIDETTIHDLTYKLHNREDGYDLPDLMTRQSIVLVHVALADDRQAQAVQLILEFLMFAAYGRVMKASGAPLPLWPVILDEADVLIEAQIEVLKKLVREGQPLRMPFILALRSWPEPAAPYLLAHLGHQIVMGVEAHDQDAVQAWITGQGDNQAQLCAMERGDLVIKLPTAEQVVPARVGTKTLWLRHFFHRLQESNPGFMLYDAHGVDAQEPHAPGLHEPARMDHPAFPDDLRAAVLANASGHFIIGCEPEQPH